MSSRKNLIPKDVRRLVARLRLPGPPLYAGTLNGEPNGYRTVKLPSDGDAAASADSGSEARPARAPTRARRS